MLAQQGLVEHLSRRGFESLVADTVQSFEMRRVLEQFAIRKAHPLDIDTFGIRNALDHMRAAADGLDTAGA